MSNTGWFKRSVWYEKMKWNLKLSFNHVFGLSFVGKRYEIFEFQASPQKKWPKPDILNPPLLECFKFPYNWIQHFEKKWLRFVSVQFFANPRFRRGKERERWAMSTAATSSTYMSRWRQGTHSMANTDSPTTIVIPPLPWTTHGQLNKIWLIRYLSKKPTAAMGLPTKNCRSSGESGDWLSRQVRIRLSRC